MTATTGPGSTALHLLAAASADVASTSKRSEKTQRLAALFAAIEPGDAEVVVGLMLGEQRQGRIGIGWSALAALDLTPAVEPSLSVGDIDTMLTEVATIDGPGSIARRGALLSAVLGRATAVELDFVRSVLLGEVRQGALAGVVSDAIATAADVKKPLFRRATMLRGDLAASAAVALNEGTAGLEAITLQPLRGIQPMLASTSESVDDAIADVGRASVEWKLDGARIQVHRDGDVVRIFTRNLNDITDRLSNVVELCLGFDARRFVLDGEILGLDADGHPLAFQDTASAVGQEDAASAASRRLTPFFFDLLLVDDDVLIDESLETRRDRLLSLAGPHAVPSTITDDPAVAQAQLAAALDAGHEGVMVKAVKSTYDAGRRGKAWRKVKPVHTLDLIVTAAEWGHGRRKGWLSNLHLAALDPDTGDAVMVGKTFKGMTDETLAWQTSTLLEREIGREGHIVHVEPDLVVEIALDGAQRSSRYPGGVALRFARLRGYRSDREAASADTLDAVRSLLRGDQPRSS